MPKKKTNKKQVQEIKVGDKFTYDGNTFEVARVDAGFAPRYAKVYLTGV